MTPVSLPNRFTLNEAPQRRSLMLMPAGVFAFLTIIAWRLPLFGHATLIHGDSIIFGLPLFDLASRELWQGGSTLWSDGVFGGHPLFAEGQGAFANPLSFAIAALITPFAGPIYALNLFEWLCMLLSGLGMLKLVQQLGFGHWAQSFAVLAVAFSPFWNEARDNPAISGTLLWAPWCLWALEVWLARPGLRAAGMLGGMTAGMLLAGYPQGLHGVLVYMAMRLGVIPFFRADRLAWGAAWRTRIATAGFAILLAVGLSAVQLLPLLELIGYSHRSDGTALVFQVPATYTWRGILYTLSGDIDGTRSIPSVGSLLACVVASLAIIFNRSSKVAGHMAAAVFLLHLGFGTSSPLFRVLYDHSLLPGLHYFRAIVLYLGIGIIGIGVLGAAAIEGISRHAAIDRSAQLSARWPTVWLLILLGLAWLAGLGVAGTTGAPRLEFATVIASLGGSLILARSNRAAIVPPFFVALLLLECVALRFQPFRFGASALLDRPGSVQAIEALPDWRDFKVIDVSLSPTYCFQPSNADAAPGVQKMLSAMSGSTPILWNLNGMDGALALPLMRLIKARPLIYDEIDGKTTTPPGARLIDALGIRFISEDSPKTTPGLRSFWGGQTGIHVMENTAARPRFQVFSDSVVASSTDEALARLRSATKPQLVIELLPGFPAPASRALPESPVNEDQPPFQLKVEQAAPTSYRFATDGMRPGWLFVADSNYPGWAATVDGQPAPVFTAQLLGKAVAVPGGHHQISLDFRPRSVVTGASISLAAAFVTTVALIFGPKMASLWRPGGRTRM